MVNVWDFKFKLSKMSRFKIGDLITTKGEFGLHRIDYISPRKAYYKIATYSCMNGVG